MSSRTNRPSYHYKKPSSNNGDLRIPVTFYTSTVTEGVYGRDKSFDKAFYSLAQAYSPSFKDIEISTSKEMIAKLTLKIRDPLDSYYPKNSHFVEVHDRRLQGKKWQIIDVRPDFDNRDFLVIVIGGGRDS